jgi:hypothetical protein
MSIVVTWTFETLTDKAQEFISFILFGLLLLLTFSNSATLKFVPIPWLITLRETHGQTTRVVVCVQKKKERKVFYIILTSGGLV